MIGDALLGGFAYLLHKLLNFELSQPGPHQPEHLMVVERG